MGARWFRKNVERHTKAFREASRTAERNYRLAAIYRYMGRIASAKRHQEIARNWYDAAQVSQDRALDAARRLRKLEKRN